MNFGDYGIFVIFRNNLNEFWGLWDICNFRNNLNEFWGLWDICNF